MPCLFGSVKMDAMPKPMKTIAPMTVMTRAEMNLATIMPTSTAAPVHTVWPRHPPAAAGQLRHRFLCNMLPLFKAQSCQGDFAKFNNARISPAMNNSADKHPNFMSTHHV